jgi:hypothetical protein
VKEEGRPTRFSYLGMNICSLLKERARTKYVDRCKQAEITPAGIHHKDFGPLKRGALGVMRQQFENILAGRYKIACMACVKSSYM